tara:strand:- start:26 stop:1195 length:1170 start_codon:yes stop_codon:yes gene_type:complete
MFSSKVNSNLIYDLSYDKKIGCYKQKKSLYKENLSLNSTLNKEKNKIDAIYEKNSKLWDDLKKFSNEYEFVYTSSYGSFKNISNIYPISRSYFKLWEILHDFDLINIKNDEFFISCHLAEGPGGFIECLYKYIIKYITDNFRNIKIYGSTLLSDNSSIPKWKLKKNIQEHFNLILNYSLDDSGDLYDINEVNKLITKIGKHNCNLITADGGFDFSNNYNHQEKDFMNLFISEAYIMLNLLKNNGNGIIKIYDIYSKNSIKIMYIISLFFEKIYIIKPLTSRPANSEKYILCYRYKNFSESKIYFNIFETIIQDKDLNHLNNDKVAVEYNFIEKILEYNRWYTERQISYINKTIKYIDDYNNNTDKNYLIKLYNYNKKKCVNWCRKYNIY